MWWIIIIIAVVIWIYYKKNKENMQVDDTAISKDKAAAADAEEDKEKEIIYAEIAKKVRAEKLGLPKIITDLYHGSLVYYPDWIKDGLKCSRISPLVTDAVKLDPEKTGKDELKEKIKITLKGNNYTFTYKEHSFGLSSGEWCTHGDLELCREDQKILALSISVNCEKIEGKEYSPLSMDEFVDGEWVNDFLELAKWQKGQSGESKPA